MPFSASPKSNRRKSTGLRTCKPGRVSFDMFLTVFLFLRLVRWPNLLMLGLIQWLVYVQLIRGPSSVLDGYAAGGLILATLLIGAAGFVINDWYDERIDRINRPEKWLAGRSFSAPMLLWIFFVMVLLGGIWTAWMGWRMGMLGWWWIYPVSIAGLWVYSSRLKCRPVLGNMWVSAFAGGAVAIMALPDLLQVRPVLPEFHLWQYVWFAFLATWYREVVKDLEDAEGDGLAGCETLVVRYGLTAGKVFGAALGIILLGSLVGWYIQLRTPFIWIPFLCMTGLLVYTLFMLRAAGRPAAFHRISTLIKVIMVIGTLILFWL